MAGEGNAKEMQFSIQPPIDSDEEGDATIIQQKKFFFEGQDKEDDPNIFIIKSKS